MHIFFLALMGDKTAVLFAHGDEIWWLAGIRVWIIIIMIIIVIVIVDGSVDLPAFFPFGCVFKQIEILKNSCKWIVKLLVLPQAKGWFWNPLGEGEKRIGCLCEED